MTVSSARKKLVFERADRCCEYCRLASDSVTVPFHVDHFIPLKHDGTDELGNLCLACFHCNMYKSHDLTGFDPDTGEITPLFNPRQHIWSEHFKLMDSYLIHGLTPHGRTTIRVLQMNIQERVENRQILAELGTYPCKTE